MSPEAEPVQERNNSADLEQAWERYHGALAQGRRLVEATERFRDHPEHRPAAYQSLLEAQAMAYNFAVAPRRDNPRLNIQTSWNTYFYTLGANSGDFYYATLFLDGSGTYRVSGRLGDARVVLMQVHDHLLGHPKSKSIGNYDFADFAIAKDGSFEIILSADEHTGNWIPLARESRRNFILLRRIFGDWHADIGDMQVQRMAGAPGNDDQDAASMIERIDMATDFFLYLVGSWNIGLLELFSKFAGNRLNEVGMVSGGNITSKYGGSPSTAYGAIRYTLKPDEAMILTLEVPDSDYWSFQLADVWGKSLDFVDHQSDVNMIRAVRDADGRVRAVIAVDDPGVPNWLDPLGRLDGLAFYRNYRARTEPLPAIEVVKASELHTRLPPETPQLSPAERAAALLYRRRGFHRMYGE
jgi:hypothetical protein